jgi:aldehyde dehydrogenase (NAD+)
MSSLQTNLFINGSYSPSSTGETLTIHNPADDSLVSDSVQVASEADVDRAVDAARSAFPAWRDTAGHKRAACMFKFADLLEREAERLAGLGRFCFLLQFFFPPILLVFSWWFD